MHSTGLVKPETTQMPRSSSSQQRRSGSWWSRLGRTRKQFRKFVVKARLFTGEMWKNTPPFHLTLNKSAARHCKNQTGRGVMKFYEFVAALAEYIGDPASKMEASIEAYFLASNGPRPRWRIFPSMPEWQVVKVMFCVIKKKIAFEVDIRQCERAFARC